MTDPADYELQKTEPPSTPPPVSRPPSLMPWIIGAVAIVVAAAFYFWQRDTAEPTAPTAASTAATDQTLPPTPPLGPQVEPVELPPLDASDDAVRQLVRALSSHPRVLAWLTTNGLIRNFVVVTSNIAEGRTPTRLLRVLRPEGPFETISSGSSIVVNARSYDRYNDLAAAVASIDASAAATLYARLKPRIEQAYAELGQRGTFDQTLERAIVALLEAPAIEGEVALLEKGGIYVYNDSRIERLTQAQKQLVRMGPRNVRTIQRKLREIALALGIPRERLP